MSSREDQELDWALFERELEDFLPDRIFDAHAHLYQRDFFQGSVPALVDKYPDMGLQGFRQAIAQILPTRQVTGGLFFGWPDPEIDTQANNDFVRDQVRRDRTSRAQMLITPEMDPELVRERVQRDGFVGLKCYHVYSDERPTFNATIPSYLPESHVRIAHEEGLSITLHMVRPRAIADPENQQVIRAWAAKYPNARFILAHAARGFNPFHTIEGIGSLHGLNNIWCDTSAVTESGAFEAIVRTLGVDRLLYGSDAPVSHIRGRCVAIGDSFLWLSEANTVFTAVHADVHPTLVGIESLRVLKLACINLGLSDSQVEKIFWKNAADLYGL
jgi:predicted TIM-barrel fold metal-dependent hydrolase